MHNYRRWLGYDTFKLIVAVILVILLLLVPRALTPPLSPAAPAASASTPAGPVAPDIPQELRASLPQGYQVRQDASGSWTIAAADGTPLFLWNASLNRWVAIEGLTAPQPATSTSAPAPTSVPTVPPTPTSLPPTPVPTAVPTQAPTEVPTPTSASPAEATPTAAPAAEATPQPAADACTAAPTRLQLGQSARVTSNLNLRSSPGIGDNLVKVNLAGITLKVIGGPQCLPYAGGAYRWWQVEGPDGGQGWSAEATLNGGMYFLEPLP